MRVVDVIQGSEQWEQIRKGVPTASNFDRIITPAKGQLSAEYKAYAAELLAETMCDVVPMLPTQWMEWGSENEPYAVEAYETLTGLHTVMAGFVWPDDHERYGCSPDRLVGDDGLLEIKCPKPGLVVQFHADGEFPKAYKPQVQGQLLITGRAWCDFVAYHPQLKPFMLRVGRDEKYIEKLRIALDVFCGYLDELKNTLVDLNQFVPVRTTTTLATEYSSSEIDL